MHAASDVHSSSHSARDDEKTPELVPVPPLAVRQHPEGVTSTNNETIVGAGSVCVCVCVCVCVFV